MPYHKKDRSNVEKMSRMYVDIPLLDFELKGYFQFLGLSEVTGGEKRLVSALQGTWEIAAIDVLPVCQVDDSPHSVRDHLYYLL